ncbi:MAG: hypothetical protein ACHQZQ_04115, partial [SAR324 cluster bacterium]
MNEPRTGGLFDRAKFATAASLTTGTTEEYLRMLERMKELGRSGELCVHPVKERYAPIAVRTLSRREKRIPTVDLWQHKSCG